jgi:deoxyribonuclease-4
MKPDVRFGPAGRPIGYKGKTTEVCNYIKEIGLDAFEYQATYGVRISKQSAMELSHNAKKNNILVSMHAPYYINLSSQKEDVIKKSIIRLVQSARAGEWMNSYRIVFHVGFYTKYSPDEAMKKTKESIFELLDKLENEGIKNYTFAPETTGKKSQIGSLDEIIDLCQTFDNFAPTVDFAHMHARSLGSIKTKDDYSKIFNKLEAELGISSIHSHFTKIEYSDKGERKHHVLADEKFGPPLTPLLELVSENDFNVTFICETPYLDIDSREMKKEYLKIKNDK